MALIKLFRFLQLAAGISMMWLVVPGAWGGVTFTTLASFTGTNGAYPGAKPYAGLALGSDGNFYGTTTSGGTNNDGTVFQLTSTGAFTSLFSFNGTNGATPYAALVQGADGNFYGTTFFGGVSNWGAIFQITTNGTFTNLFSFTGTNYPYLGANPAAALVPAGDGSFYGTADYGGAYTNAIESGYGYGTVFNVTTNGTVTVPAFFNGTNGAYSYGGMVLGKDGNFYGTTAWGGRGITSSFPGYGTVFKMTPAGTLTNIYLFTGFGDGGFVYAGLVQGGDGNLYGGTFNGGAYGYGTLFKVSTNGSFTLLHTFIASEVGSPYGGLTEGSDGNFYGTTYGLYGYGTVFQLTPGGAFTNLVSFNSANGAHPEGVLVQGPDGNFYGTTSLGGANGLGTIFRLSVPMPAVFKAITLTNGTATLTWSAVVGQTYQPQYSTNLAQTNWNTLSKPFAAFSGIMTTTDFNAGGSPQRFYRVMLFP